MNQTLIIAILSLILILVIMWVGIWMNIKKANMSTLNPSALTASIVKNPTPCSPDLSKIKVDDVFQSTANMTCDSGQCTAKAVTAVTPVKEKYNDMDHPLDELKLLSGVCNSVDANKEACASVVDNYLKPEYPNDRSYLYSIADDDYNTYKDVLLDNYKKDHPTIQEYAEIGTNESDGDSANVAMIKAMNRDKRKMDSARGKTSDYYKYHFADELDYSENHVWWGNYDDK